MGNSPLNSPLNGRVRACSQRSISKCSCSESRKSMVEANPPEAGHYTNQSQHVAGLQRETERGCRHSKKIFEVRLERAHSGRNSPPNSPPTPDSKKPRQHKLL